MQGFHKHQPRSSRTALIAWCFFDFAGTAFSTLFLTMFYPLFVKQMGGDELQIGVVIGVSLLVAAVLSPFFGVLADVRYGRRPIIFLCMAAAVICVALTGFVGFVGVLALGFLANAFETLNENLYDAYLPELAPAKKQGLWSGIGTASGYAGMIAALLIGGAIFSSFGLYEPSIFPAMFLTAAALYMIFALPLFVVTDETADRQAMVQRDWTAVGAKLRSSIIQLRSLLAHLKDIRGLFPFLAASFFYVGAMYCAILFISLYGNEQAGLTIKELFLALMGVAVSAGIGSVLFGLLSDRWGPRRSLMLILCVWIGAVCLLLISGRLQSFLIASFCGAGALGGAWTCNRHLTAIMAPPLKVNQIFGLVGLVSNVAGAVMPIGFSYLVVSHGYPAALLFLLALFTIGLLIFYRWVPESALHISVPGTKGTV